MQEGVHSKGSVCLTVYCAEYKIYLTLKSVA